MNKKGQGGMLTRVFVYLAYGLSFLLVLTTLEVNSRFKGGSPSTIKSDTPDLQAQLADEQLVALLRTPVPNDIVEKVEFIQDNPEMFIEDYDEIWLGHGAPIPADRAIAFLQEHPEVYIDKTYAEFIVGLEAFMDSDGGRAKETFDVVTKTMFVQKIADKIGRDAGDKYISPVIRVEYGVTPGSKFTPLPPERWQEADTPKSEGDDIVGLGGKGAQAGVSLLPLPEGRFARVQLFINTQQLFAREPEI